MPLYSFDGVSPVLPEDGDCFIAPGAQIIGKVRIGKGASVWFNAVIRGDNEWITLGPRVNVQDGCVLHTDPGCPIELGEEASIGHNVILHGCTIGAGALIGMGATVLNRARIGAGCLVGANALVTEGKEFPDNALIVGSPAKVARIMEGAQANAGRMTSAVYAHRAAAFRKSLKALD
ncbi:MAG: gamma carbonic anhydrase family protein [Hyphomicrobiales bacterium]|nr:gamma carbonic anhydrase family protein [Hyphomicrobiales bacterium]